MKSFGIMDFLEFEGHAALRTSRKSGGLVNALLGG